MTYSNMRSTQGMCSGIPSTRQREWGVVCMDCYISMFFASYFTVSLGLADIKVWVRFRIDAITLFGLPAVGPHGFHAIGR